MKLEAWTLFIDILGYGQMNGAIKNDEEAALFIAFMKSNVQLFQDQDNEQMKAVYEGDVFNLYKYYDIKVLFVSDSVMISYKPKDVDEVIDEKLRMLHSANTLFIILQRLQIYIYNCMNEKKILVRGGISNKFSLIEDQFAVGEGIIEAYVLESKKAKYPRIVVSQDIIDNSTLMSAVRYLSQRIYKLENILEKDNDNIYYIDYIGFNIRCALQGGINSQNIATYDAFLNQHKDTIKHHIAITKSKIAVLKTVDPIDREALSEQEKIMGKYVWLKEYHNRKIRMFEDQTLQQRFLIA